LIYESHESSEGESSWEEDEEQEQEESMEEEEEDDEDDNKSGAAAEDERERYENLFSPISSDDSQVDLCGEMGLFEELDPAKPLPAISEIDLRMEILHANCQLEELISAKYTEEQVEYDRKFFEEFLGHAPPTMESPPPNISSTSICTSS